ncbi:Uncharacterised protein [Serratia fonticola]|uniref:Uncharacterized protein n=1 Tax=Serratia fonticola TaxID=47917 RepID=A0A4U9TS78_SERFO|nr:Uncharacterised protein [Serratia fonticola]
MGIEKYPAPEPQAGFNSGLLVGEYEHAERMDFAGNSCPPGSGLQLRSVYLQQPATDRASSPSTSYCGPHVSHLTDGATLARFPHVG